MRVKAKVGAMGQKRARNPFAVCRAMQKRKGWSEAKYKRCAEEIKTRKRMSGRRRR